MQVYDSITAGASGVRLFILGYLKKDNGDKRFSFIKITFYGTVILHAILLLPIC